MLFSVSRSGLAAVPAKEVQAALLTLPVAFRFIGPMLAAVIAHDLDVFAIGEPAARWPCRRARLSDRPTVALVGDDPGAARGLGGPGAWQCTAAIRRWCNAAIVHAAGGEPHHYREAVLAALLVGRVAFIETTSANAQAWAERLACPATLLILPREGAHPIDNRVLH
jgi:hypothetical protein